jgi:hypothetical protein
MKASNFSANADFKPLSFLSVGTKQQSRLKYSQSLMSICLAAWRCRTPAGALSGLHSPARNAPPPLLGAHRPGKETRTVSHCFSVLDPFLHCRGGYRVVEKKTDSGPDFRLTRSRHPSASGRRIGSSPGDGWAVRRGPQANSGVFYWAGL